MIPRQVIYKSGFRVLLSLIETITFHLGFIKPGRSEVETEIIVKHVRGFKNKILSCFGVIKQALHHEVLEYWI